MSHRSPRRTHKLSVLVALSVSGALSSTVRSDCSLPQVDAPYSVQVDPAARQRQTNALRAMTLDSLELSPRGQVELLHGRTGIVLPANIASRKVGQPADDVLRLLSKVLMASGTESLTVRENPVVHGSEGELSMEQSIRGRPVLHVVVSLGYDTQTRQVTTIVTNFVPDHKLPAKPRLSAPAAERALMKALALAETGDPMHVVINDGTYLGYFASFEGTEPAQLVWAVIASVGGEREEFLVDSLTGIVAFRRPLSSDGPRKQAREITGARCQCAGKKSFTPIPAKPFRNLRKCGRLVSMNWSPVPNADRYVAQAALPELGWMFSDLVIDNTSPQCTCEVPKTVHMRMMACNSCGCGPWSNVKVIEVKADCPVFDDMPAD